MADKTIKLEQLSYFYGKLKGIFVQKDGSKVLSDNNYTNEEKAKLAAIAEKANNYTLPVATDKALGGVKVGTGINKAEDGTISVTAAPSIFFANVDVLSKGTVLLTDINTNGQIVKVGDTIIDVKHDRYFVTGVTAESGKKDQDGYVAASVTVGDAIGTNDIANKTDVQAALDKKVDKAGYIAYTQAEKDKLAAIADKANNYTLPAATADTLGGVKVGANLTIKDGVLSAVQGTVDLTPFLKSTDAEATYVSQTALSTTLKDYAVKADIASAVNYKGSVDAFANLPAADAAKVGDMYNVKAAGGNAGDGTEIKAGDNVVWNGTAWDNMGGTFVINYATQDDIDAIFTSSSDAK